MRGKHFYKWGLQKTYLLKALAPNGSIQIKKIIRSAQDCSQIGTIQLLPPVRTAFELSSPMSARPLLEILQQEMPQTATVEDIAAECAVLDPARTAQYHAAMNEAESELKSKIAALFMTRYNAITLTQLFQKHGMAEGEVSNLNVVLGSATRPHVWQPPPAAPPARQPATANAEGGAGGDDPYDADDDEEPGNLKKRGGRRTEAAETLLERRPDYDEYGLPHHLCVFQGTQSAFLKLMVQEVCDSRSRHSDLSKRPSP